MEYLEYIVDFVLIISLGVVLYFFIMFYVLQFKSIKLFWKDRNDPKYEELWGDNVFLFTPIFFPLKRMITIVNNNEELKNNEKILKFLNQIRKIKKLFICMIVLCVLLFGTISLAKANGATWVK